MKKIAILYICNNGYDIFWKDFYLSCEKFFLNDLDERGNKRFEKQYFIFSDINSEKLYNPMNNINFIKIENLGWVKNVLMKYDNFLKIKDKLLEFDFVFAFNANYLFIRDINSEEFLPDTKNGEKFLAVISPNEYGLDPQDHPHEKNKKSLAYFNPKDGRKEYFISCLMGGLSKDYLEACEIMNKYTRYDLKKGIVAIYHDQSYLNKFLSERNDVKILGPSYAYPEDQKFSFEKKIILRGKTDVSFSFWFKKVARYPLHKRILISIKYIIGFYIKKILKLFNIYLS